MPESLTQAQPALEFIPPAFNPLVVRGVDWLLPHWIRWNTPLESVECAGVERLAELYRRFQAGEVRLLLAFRHPSTLDPFAMGYLLKQLVPRAARQQGISLQSPIHSHFIYDRGIPLWAGDWISWLYSRLGGIPIMRGKVDWTGLKAARDILANGAFPLMAAPEGATNGHNEIISPLEPGIAQLGFWCQEDLLKAGRTEEVLIVPIGIQYHYVDSPWTAVEKLLSQLEADCGLTVDPSQPLDRYQRLFRLGEHLLTRLEEFYSRFYHISLPTPAEAGDQQSPNQRLGDRLQALLNAALQVAEQYFGITPKGTVIERCRRLEQAGWDYIFREDIRDRAALSPVERGLADRVAEEANLRMWHMRLVESFVAVTGAYVQEKPSPERFAETAILVWDALTRIKGESPYRRPVLGKQQVQMQIGEPLSVTARWPAYQTNRRAARQAVTDLTQDLQTSLQAMIRL